MKFIQLHEKIDINSLYINQIGLHESKRYNFVYELKEKNGKKLNKNTYFIQKLQA